MSTVCSSDFHLHPWRRFSTITEDGLNSRLVEQVECLMGMINWMKDHRPTHFFFLGDLTHAQGSYLDKDTIRAAFVILEKIQELGVTTIMIPGNHDVVRGRTMLKIFKDLPNIHIITKPTVLPIDGREVAFVPFRGKFKDFEDDIEQVLGANDLCCHAMFKGTAVGPQQYDFILRDSFPIESVSSFERVFSGHCHKYQQLANVIYPGSPYQMDFGDEGDERGYLITDAQTISHISIDGPRFETEILRTQEEANRFLKARNPDWYYRVTVSPAVSLPSIDHRIEVYKERGKPHEGRVKVKDRPQEEIILEAIKVMFPDKNHNFLLEEALKLWKDID